MKPITSRIKRSPLFSYGESPMKQTATTGGSEKGKDKTIKEKKKSSYDGKKMSDEEWAALTPAERRRLNAAVGANEQGEIITEVEKTVEGDDLDYNADLYTKKEDKVVQGPSNTRMQERSKIFTNRKVNKYRRKLGKYGSFDMEGNFTPNENLSQRDIRKMLQAKGNLEGSQAGKKNVQEGLESGTGLGGKYYGGQRKMDKGELDKSEQKEQALREAKLERRRQSEGAIDVMPVNPFANMATLNVPPLTTPSVNYMDLLKSSPNNMKKGYTQKAKSPATKALKGAQNTLPQHLQDAIKAAPGKMRGPLKKGYFKGV